MATYKKLYVPVGTLLTEDKPKFQKLLSENKYKVIPNKTYDTNAGIKELIDAIYQGVKIFLLLLIEMLVVLIRLRNAFNINMSIDIKLSQA